MVVRAHLLTLNFEKPLIEYIDPVCGATPLTKAKDIGIRAAVESSQQVMLSGASMPTEMAQFSLVTNPSGRILGIRTSLLLLLLSREKAFRNRCYIAYKE